MSFYVSTATFFLLHCDEWDRVVALPRHKFVTGATLLQLPFNHLQRDMNIKNNFCDPSNTVFRATDSLKLKEILVLTLF